MRLHKFLPILASVALVACLPRPAPTSNPPTAQLATISALLPTTLAAYKLSAKATPEPSSTPFLWPTLAAYPGTVTVVPFTPLPPAPVIGVHVVQPGETIFCIGRAYGVLPTAIAQANGLSQTFFISPGQVLQIPAVQWTDIAAGSVCLPQFQSPFPGLAVPTAALAVGAAPVSPSLAVSLNLNCIANCGSKDGSYVMRLQVLASGGVQPYTYSPAQVYDVTVPHCTTGQGTAMVTASDRQTAQASWTYHDVACP